MIDVLVADDSDLFRQRLTTLISEMEHAQVIRGVGDGFEALDAVRELQPDVVILDFHMPGTNGTALIEAIMQETAKPDVIVCTAFPHPLVRQACLDLGVICFLDKTLGVQRVIEALKLCMEGRARPDEGVCAPE